MKYLNIILIIVFFLFSISLVSAQDSTSSHQENNKVEELKKIVEEQGRQVKLMQDQIEKQNAIVQEQQKQINELLKNKEQKETTASEPAKPADATTVAKTTAQPTPKPVTPVESGFGKIKFNGLLQGFYAAGTDLKNTFRFRRAELKFSGQINPNVKWTVMIDPSKAFVINTTSTTINGTPVVISVSANQASRIFQDAFITLNYLKNVTIDVGQYKIPLSQEGLQSSAALDTVERALFMSDRLRGGHLAIFGILVFSFRDRSAKTLIIASAFSTEPEKIKILLIRIKRRLSLDASWFVRRLSKGFRLGFRGRGAITTPLPISVVTVLAETLFIRTRK